MRPAPRAPARGGPLRGPGVARLFPPAYPEDPLRNLDFERGAGDELVADRLAALDIVETTVDAERLARTSSGLARLGERAPPRARHAARLTEETTEADFPRANPDRDAFGMYLYLTWLEGGIVEGFAEA